MDKSIGAKLNYAKEIHDIGMKRDTQIKELAIQASNPNPSVQDVNKFSRTSSIMTLEILNELNKNITQILKSQAEAEAREWEQMRKRMIAQEKSDAYFKNIVAEASKDKPKKDAYQILREVPK
jgi:hypothetical protein